MMKIEEDACWVYYIGKTNLEKDKSGKWMLFFKDNDFASKICKEVVEKEIIPQAKHGHLDEKPTCFFLNYDDIDTHKKLIKYFIDNNLIQKTKKGKLYNISFKLDIQTHSGQYGKDFSSNIKLEQFVNLETGELIS